MPFASKIKKLFGFKEHKKIEAIRTSIHDVINIVRKSNENEINNINEESKKFRSQILSDFQELKKTVEDFRSIKQFDELSKASTLVKNHFCDRMLGILTEIKGIESLDSKDFVIKAYEIIDRIEKITPRQAMHINLFFRDSAKEIANKTKEIRQSLNEYQEFLDTSILTEIENIKKKISETREIEDKIKYIETKINDIEKEKNKMEIKDLPSVDYTRLDELKKELNELVKVKKEIEQNVETAFGVVKKVLKKFSYGLADKQKLNIIERYLSSASEGFLIKDKGFEIKKILEEIKSLKEAGKIELEEKQYNKICYIIRNPSLLAKKDEYNKINSRIKNKEKEIENEKINIKEIEKIRDKIKETKNRIDELNKMKSQLEESKNRMISEKIQKMKDIESICSELVGAKIILQ